MTDTKKVDLPGPTQTVKHVWLDVDPGHDDAIAILLALHCPNIRLLGVSTTYGNSNTISTMRNAARCLFAFGASQDLRVFPGAEKPLIMPVSYAPEIHGLDGLGGVEGLPAHDDARIAAHIATTPDGTPIRALEGMERMIRKVWNKGAGDKTTVVSSGPMTNIALFISVYPELLSAVSEFVFMGGGVGMGNYSPTAEFNILRDPHAAQIVMNVPVKKTMIPINVTHSAIVTLERQARMLDPCFQSEAVLDILPEPSTNLRHTLSTLVTFFAETYKVQFGFEDGPPLHDALAVAYVSRPELFTTARYRVDVELSGTHSLGETVVDIWNSRRSDDSWGATGKNCQVAQSLDVNAFFNLFFACAASCDDVSPLNTVDIDDQHA